VFFFLMVMAMILEGELAIATVNMIGENRGRT